MAPTGPINGPKPAKGVGSNNVPNAQVKSQSAQQHASKPESQARSATVATSLAESRAMLESARDTARKVDERLIEELRQAITEGQFTVDPHALAERMINDAAGSIDPSHLGFPVGESSDSDGE
jgi:flagellar biosynthesis anti-sigma factor FlgM